MIEFNKQKKYLRLIQEKNRNKGKQLKYNVETFGCSLNENDSEKIAGILEEAGYMYTASFNDADIIVFNTCCIRENAEKRLFGRVGETKKVAEEKGSIIAVGGCMMQEPQMVKKIQKSYPFVSIIFGTHTLHKLPENIYQILSGEKKVYDILDIDGEVYEGLPVKRAENSKAYISIMYGCNNFCTYCIVPYVRGRERSRKPENILNEAKELAKDGFKEITLLGQNVNSYKGEGNILDFADLLNEVCKIDGIETVRFVSPHPKDFSDKVIDIIAKNEKVSRNIHFPLQSGSTRILKKMNRKYTKEMFIERAKKIKERIPDVAFSTDIIVGFPGETEEDFKETLDVVSKVEFDQIFMFIYSPRKGTVAYNMKDEYIDIDVATLRLEKLKKLHEDMIDNINEKYIGTEEEVIIEGESKNNKEMLSARTSANKIVVFPKFNGWKEGLLVKVKLTKNHRWYLRGEIVQ